MKILIRNRKTCKTITDNLLIVALKNQRGVGIYYEDSPPTSYYLKDDYGYVPALYSELKLCQIII